MGQRLKTELNCLKPCMEKHVKEKQETMCSNKTLRDYKENDTVYVRNFSTCPKWLRGTIVMRTGPLSYVVLLSSNKTVRRHFDHIRVQWDTETSPTSSPLPSTIPEAPVLEYAPLDRTVP